MNWAEALMSASFIGVLLSLRVNVVALFVIAVAAVSMLVGWAAVTDTNFWRIVLTAVGVLVALQLGYVAGIILQRMFPPADIVKNESKEVGKKHHAPLDETSP